MSEQDASEIQKQVQELVDTGLVETSPKGEDPNPLFAHLFGWKEGVKNQENGWTVQKGEWNDQKSLGVLAQNGGHARIPCRMTF